MIRRMETTVSLAAVVAGEPAAAFDALVDELAESLGRRGMTLEPGDGGRLLERGLEVGRVVAWQPGERILLEWRQADWASDEVTEVEVRFTRAEEGTTVSLEHRGFGRLLWDDRDVVGWFADQAVAPLLAASAPVAFGDWLTDRAARRPGGVPQRESYRDPSHHRPSFGAVLAALDLQPDDVLLEIGCGGGAFLEQALRSGCRAAGIDHSPEMVRVARDLNAQAIAQGRLELVEASAERLPFGDDSFTCAAMMQVFFFLPDAEAVLAECRRVLRPGGRLAVFTISELARGTPAAPEPMASRSRFYTEDELVRLARAAGFADASVEHPDLEPHARAAGLPDDVVKLFAGDPVGGQLLVAE
jgi:SAM-dependent methyltransferase